MSRLALVVAWIFAARFGVASAAAPASDDTTAARDSAGALVLAELSRAEAPLLLRYVLTRERDEPRAVHAAIRDSAAVDASWMLRFERLCANLPAEPCRERPLVPGQRYEYLLAVSAADVSVGIDFRTDCVRLMRGPDVAETRSLKGSREPMALLLLRANTRDKQMLQLAQALGVAPVDPSPGKPLPPPVARQEIPAMDAKPDVDVFAEPVSKPQPDYPDIARDAGVQGTVFVMALVGIDGSVRQTRVTKSIPMLDDAAQAAVRRWVFKPAMKDGQPVPVWVPVPVAFKLH